jgi:hypothetical protein
LPQFFAAVTDLPICHRHTIVGGAVKQRPQQKLGMKLGMGYQVPDKTVMFPSLSAKMAVGCVGTDCRIGWLPNISQLGQNDEA